MSLQAQPRALPLYLNRKTAGGFCSTARFAACCNGRADESEKSTGTNIRGGL